MFDFAKRRVGTLNAVNSGYDLSFFIFLIGPDSAKFYGPASSDPRNIAQRPYLAVASFSAKLSNSEQIAADPFLACRLLLHRPQSRLVCRGYLPEVFTTQSSLFSYRRLHEGINYRLRTFAGGRVASFCRPTSIALLLTERCNARCIHCDIWKNRGPEDRPSSDEWRGLLGDLRRWLGPVQVVLTGGEALLNPNTIDLVSYGSFLGLFIELLSHGFWEDQSKIERLALARPGRVTISFDGIGETHNKIRGRDNFFERTERTIQTLTRMRRDHGLKMDIRLKTVIMRQNLDDVCEVARFAARHGLEVFYQPIEQNYNTPEDSRWFEHSKTWPNDALKTVKVVRQLGELKKLGLPIANSLGQLDVMIPYFLDPAGSRVAIQSHSAHEPQLLCSAATTLQIQANGDVKVCSSRGAIGNFRSQPIRTIWAARPHWWQQGCCLEERAGLNCPTLT